MSTDLPDQSTPDKLLPLRLALYLIGTLYEYAKMNNTAELPELYSLIYYHGKQIPYPYNKSIWGMFGEDYEAEKHLLDPIFVDLGTMSDEQLIEHKETAGAELAFKHIFSKNLGQYVESIAKGLRYTDDSTRVNVLRYVLNAGEAPSGIEVLKRLAQALPEEEKLIMTIAEQLRQEARYEGMQQGMHEAKLGVARNMLFKNADQDLAQLKGH